MNQIRCWMENAFERSLIACRLFVLFAVIGSLIAAVGEFSHFGEGHSAAVILHFIAAVDNFLFATVLLIFSMGVYELFVSKIDPCSRTAEIRPTG